MSFRHGFVTVVMMKHKSKKWVSTILFSVVVIVVVVVVFEVYDIITTTDTNVHEAVNDVSSLVVSIFAFSLSLVSFEKDLKKIDTGHVDLYTDVMSYDRFNEVCRYLEYWRKRPDTEQYPAMQNMGLNSLLDMLVRYGVRNNHTKTVTVYLFKDDILMLHEFLGMCSAGKPNKAELPQTDYVHLKADRILSYCEPDK